MHVVFRADASRVTGTGHVMRCLTLADALRARGVTISFVCRAQDGDLCEHVESRGIALTRLTGFGSPVSVAEALDESWECDARETAAAIDRATGGARADWLVVDHYGLDGRFEESVRSAAERVLVIDDLANRRHDCDVILDQNLVANSVSRYDGHVPPSCERLIGPAYALLHPAFAAAARTLPARSGRVRRILVYFGGADRDDLTGRTLDAIAASGHRDVAIDVVVGLNATHRESVRERAARMPGATVHAGLPHLAELMARADLAVGAGGSSTWERLCMGLPTLAVILAENQRAIVEQLNSAGVLRSLGNAADVTTETMAAALDDLLSSGIPAHWARQCTSLVDGHGAGRVAAALGAAPGSPVRVRRAATDDEARVLEWANDPQTRANAFSTRPIAAEEHHRWFDAQLRAHGATHYFIVEQGGIPVGQVRFTREDGAWELHYLVAPKFRGRRLAASLLAAALQQLRAAVGDVRVFGRVKGGNHASDRVFETLGFAPNRADGAGVVTYERRA